MLVASNLCLQLAWADKYALEQSHGCSRDRFCPCIWNEIADIYELKWELAMCDYHSNFGPESSPKYNSCLCWQRET